MGSEVLAVVELLAWGFLLASVIVLAGAVVVMATSLRQSPSMVLSQLLRPMMLAAATTNSLVCIPASLEAMTDGLRAARQPCNLFIPVGFATIRFGTVIYFTVTTMFMALLTGRRLSLLDLIAVPALSFAASFATLGAAGLAALGPLATVLRSFGLSYELALPLLVVIDPVANMIRTVLNVTVNCAIPALAGGRGTETPAPDPAVDMVTT
jgi:proton glutamate symport protein